MASGVYILNDVLDLDADRSDPKKIGRPFASGTVPVLHGLALSLVLVPTGFGIGALLSQEFVMIRGIRGEIG